MKRVLLIFAVVISSACAERKIVAEVVPEPPRVEKPAPPKTVIKYVYVKEPQDTMSAMTMPPMDPPASEPRNLAQDVLKVFWPLLTLLAVGAVMIVGLFIEYKVFDRQLARRRELKTTYNA